MIDKIKKYGIYVFGILGVAIFWGGLWGTAHLLVPQVYITFLIGLFLLAFANTIKEKIDTSHEKGMNTFLGKLKKHPQKHKYHIKYYDKIKKHHVKVNAGKFHKLEKSHLIFLDGKKEFFVPLSRVKEITLAGKKWNAK